MVEGQQAARGLERVMSKERQRDLGLFSLEKKRQRVGSYCCLQLPRGERRKNGPRLILGEQQLKDKRQRMQIATREIMVRYERKKLLHHGGIQTLGQGPRKHVGSPSLEAFKICQEQSTEQSHLPGPALSRRCNELTFRCPFQSVHHLALFHVHW